MKSIAKWLGISVSAFAVLAAAGIAYVLTIDVEAYRETIVERVREATGREVSIGAIGFEPSLVPKVVLERVTFANAAWAKEPRMLTVERFEAVLEIAPLLSRELRVKRLVVERPVVHLETDASGVGNWSLGLATSGASPGQPIFGGFSVETIEVSDARVTFRDDAAGLVHDLHLARFSARAPSLDEPVDIEAAAMLDGHELEVTARIGAPRALLDNASLPVALTLNTGEIRASFEGLVEKPLAPTGLVGRGEIALVTLHDLSALVGTELPDVGPVSMAGNVNYDVAGLSADLAGGIDDVRVSLAARLDLTAPALTVDGSLALSSKAGSTLAALSGGAIPVAGASELKGDFSVRGQSVSARSFTLVHGRSDLAGSFSIDMAGEPLRVNATLTSSRLWLDELEEPGAKTPPGGRLFSSEPLALDRMRAVDADVTFAGERVEFSGHRLDATSVSARLAAGHLAAQSRAGAFGGQVEATLELDGAAKVPAFVLKAEGKQLSLATLLERAIGADVMAGGPTRLDADLRGTGASVAAIMGSLDGRFEAVVGRGRLDDAALKARGGGPVLDVVAMVNPFGVGGSHTELECAVVKFDVRDGVARTEKGIAIETDKVLVVGSGTIDLGAETLDIGIKPSPRKGVGLGAGELAGLVRLTGPLSAPTVSADAAGLLGAGASVGAAVATGGLSLLAQGLLSTAMSDSHPCDTALGRKPSTRAASKKQTDEPAGGVAETARSVAEDVGKAAGEVTKSIGGALKGLFGN